MGNTTSSNNNREKSAEHVDGGTVYPHPDSVYFNTQQDWDKVIVRDLILQRKLAPFYKGLNDYNDDMSDIDIIQQKYNGSLPPNSPHVSPQSQVKTPRRSASSSSANLKKPTINPETFIYKNAQECPICFLFYPSNQNRSRCCDQPLCTDCFVQIKRSEPSTTHLESEPAACPYCAQDNFGITYSPPQWRTGNGASPSLESNLDKLVNESSAQTQRPRRKSISADSSDVVTSDAIRPEWKAKLESVRAQAARRANRRIIMRQVGDRLVPIGVTSSRHPLANSQLPPGLFLSSEGDVQSSPHQANPEQGTQRVRSRSGRRAVDNLVNSLGNGADLEDAMILEAMRLSLLEEEERGRRREEEEIHERQALERSSSQVDITSADNQHTHEPIQTPTAAHTVHEAPPIAPPTDTLPERTTSIHNNNNNGEHSSPENKNSQQSRPWSDSVDGEGVVSEFGVETAADTAVPAGSRPQE
ncbi:hypothetical protein E3P92_00592 [Wallemia ichthyophaga]|nr:hypothetical protein E3P91_00256 [Wallemia ichthyophaga]TIA80542.1 hypothetical protein E3P98_02623 [Wallemia ichthyophaga]TIA99174.1 hypothetical protein E3P95_02156 [Wallemia ichthyophaga]TIB04551.1 hypothetical protein E3P94_00538 [Wallemia ichthyophaga]TIB18443.1 hypothetical protein E3P92_00592 [Wallemia ichthyophaga]